jgi:hypothetical protein
MEQSFRRVLAYVVFRFPKRNGGQLLRVWINFSFAASGQHLNEIAPQPGNVRKAVYIIWH